MLYERTLQLETCLQTNLLFFDRSGPIKNIWYYELPLPKGRKNHSKTKSMQFAEFADSLKRFAQKRRKEDDQARKVPVADVLKHDDKGNLDIGNPNSAEALEHLPPENHVTDNLLKELWLIEIMQKIEVELAGASS